MISDKLYEQQICRKHNLPLEFLNPDKSKPNDFYVCIQCFMEYHKAISIQQIKQSNQRIIKQFEEQLNQNSKIWNISIHSLISLKEAFTKSIKMIENIIDVIRNQIQQTINEFQNMNINQKEGIKQAHESYLQTQLTHQRNIIQQIEVLKQNSSIDKLIQGLNEINLQQLNHDDQQQIQKQQDIDQAAGLNFLQFKNKRCLYQLIPESSIKQNKYCYAMAFNYDCSTLVAGCEEIIQVFEFKNNQLKKVQSLEGHKNLVNCLQFMKKSNQFISGSCDNTIKIWQVSNRNQYINIQTLKGHNSFIYCIIINSNDDVIVSGSYDGSIIFWGLVGQQWQLDQQIQCSSIVYSLSFNDSNTKLISCEENKLIQVFEQQGKKWIISQNIQVETKGLRLCFIRDDQFVFLPFNSKQLHFYKLDLQTNKFEKLLEVQVKNSYKEDCLGFPIKFIKSKNLIIVRKCQFVNILRSQGDFTFIQEQSIEFNTCDLQGDASEDGNVMVTWDSGTKEYQVRHLNQVQ